MPIDLESRFLVDQQALKNLHAWKDGVHLISCHEQTFAGLDVAFKL